MNGPILPPRAFAEDCRAVIDLPDLLQTLAEAQPEAWARYCQMGDARLFAPLQQPFPHGGGLTVTFALNWRHGSARLAWRRPQGAGAQVVELAASLSPAAGLKWWWTCPASERPCRRLYLPEGARHFAGREAHRLIYRREAGGEPERARRRAAKLRQALGESPPAVGGAMPAKPPRMGAEVYARAVEAIRESEAALPRR
jgi:hypothetical protein